MLEGHHRMMAYRTGDVMPPPSIVAQRLINFSRIQYSKLARAAVIMHCFSSLGPPRGQSC